MSDFSSSEHDTQNANRSAIDLGEIDVFDHECLDLVHKVMDKIDALRDSFYLTFRDTNFQKKDPYSLGSDRKVFFGMLAYMALFKGLLIQIIAVFEKQDDSPANLPRSESLFKKMNTNKEKIDEYIKQFEVYGSMLSNRVDFSISEGKYVIKFKDLSVYDENVTDVEIQEVYRIGATYFGMKHIDLVPTLFDEYTPDRSLTWQNKINIPKGLLKIDSDEICEALISAEFDWEHLRDGKRESKESERRLERLLRIYSDRHCSELRQRIRERRFLNRRESEKYLKIAAALNCERLQRYLIRLKRDELLNH